MKNLSRRDFIRAHWLKGGAEERQTQEYSDWIALGTLAKIQKGFKTYVHPVSLEQFSYEVVVEAEGLGVKSLQGSSAEIFWHAIRSTSTRHLEFNLREKVNHKYLWHWMREEMFAV